MAASRTCFRAAGLAALLTTCGAPLAYAAPYLIVGNDQKTVYNDHGKGIVQPTGKDTVDIIDLAEPESPRIVASLPLENSIAGPPTNEAVTPDGQLALVADSVTTTGEGDNLKTAPANNLFIIDLTANPPKLQETLTVGRQPSGLAISPDGKLALVAYRADGTIGVLKISGTKVTQLGAVPVAAGVSGVTFTPDGKRALVMKSPNNVIAVLDVNGEQVTYSKLDLPTYQFPYNVAVTPDGALALTADNGFNGSSDGNMDAVSVIDLAHNPPYVTERVTVPDAPEGLAISPKGNLAVVLSVNGSNNRSAWFYHPHGIVTVLAIDGGKVRPIKQIEVGAMPEPVAFSPDGQYIYIGNFIDGDFAILRVEGTVVTDTGKRFKVNGHPASARMGPG